ncbi:hypothetical protein GCM10011586_21690 [Silvibacterium dinghuense]|nr:hypothetical protein GCM10011586_21690 [Silvibacterium dinghuense]
MFSSFSSAAGLRVFLLFLLVPASFAVAATPAATAQQSTTASREHAEDELHRRLQAAEAARLSGNPVSIAYANQQLVQVALRMMAKLKQGTAASGEIDAGKRQAEELRRILGQSFSDLATAEAIQQNYAAALGHYQDAEKWDADVPDLDRNLGQSAFRVKNYPEAVRALALAVKADPEKPALRAMLGMSYFAMEKYGDAATAFYPLGMAGMEDGEVGYAWAVSLARVGDPDHASEVLEHYQQLALPDAMKLSVAQLWIEIGNYEKAVDELHAALAVNPSLQRAHYYAGLADIHWQHLAEARKEFEAELMLTPGDTDTTYELGYVDVQESTNEDAQQRFEAVLAVRPDYGNAQYELGKLLMSEGEMKEALPHLEAAAKLMPGMDYVHYQLQSAYRRNGRIADADRELAIYREIKAKERQRIAQGLQQKQKP